VEDDATAIDQRFDLGVLEALVFGLDVVMTPLN
jgi:hypothetical protein